MDQDAFKTLMEEQRVRARKAREALGDLGWAGIEFGKDMPATRFLGYTQTEAQGQILALVAEEELRDEVGTGAEAIVVLDQTPFYAEMGGQIADHGVIPDRLRPLCGPRRPEEQGRQVYHTRVVKSGAREGGGCRDASIDVGAPSGPGRAHSATTCSSGRWRSSWATTSTRPALSWS